MDLLPNEVFALECRKRYEEQGLIVDERTIHNGRRAQFAHCPLPKGMGDRGYYLIFEDHQHQGLLQSKDVGRRCFWAPDVKLWLDTKPPGYKELYVIYKKYISGGHCPQFGVLRTKEWKKANSERLSGENNPMFGMSGALSPSSKAIIAIKPDGTELHFGSVCEAARELEMNQGNLCGRYLKTGKQPKRGKFKGWQFFYEVKE